jgi:hypothetical protein
LTYVFLTEEDFQQSGILAIFLESKILLGAFIASLLLLFYLMWIELINNRPIRKSALKRMFYIQCYITSPAVLIITLVFRFTNTVQVFQEYLLASAAFIIFYEMFVMKIELDVGWRTALWRAVQPLLVISAAIAILLFALNS